MYSGYGGSSPISNNPFVTDPTNAHARYPDISSPGPSSPGPGLNPQYTSWQQPQYPQQTQFAPQQTGYGGYPPQQPQQQFSPVQSQPMPFQSGSGFSQQLGVPSGYGYQQQPQLQSQYTGYPQQSYGSGYQYLQQQPQQNAYQPPPPDVSQFDPLYAPNNQQQQPSQQTGSVASPNQSHPREFIRTHKSELEAWDSYTWKQLLNSFEALQSAWEGRKREVNSRMAAMGGAGYGYGYGEIERLQSLVKQAEDHFSAVAASSFQMREVLAGYRQSSDPASKRRVRESCNAALNSLPEWPPAQW
ncbi:hypothetical protein PLICRDRAFT_40152 [Plicaturopsis crispa FD-325 SS-3]|nr:hypothetical protein PLICRDRAFT_40152 [Plicaturopsis crispa FD-325 SS-3]